jgi:signal transduction histidine kinase
MGVKVRQSFKDNPTRGEGVERAMSSAASHINPSPAGGHNPAGANSHSQQNLQHLDRLANLGLFSASIAHEIKNGLVAINTFCEVLAEKEENPEMAKMVRRELKRIDGLVSQMLSLASPKQARMASVNVHALLDLSLRLLEHQMIGRMVTLRRDYQAAPEMVHGDESRLQQAFMNLMLNAVESMGHGGKLTVATKSVDGKVKISIRDTGGGISPENFERIFDTFFTTKRNGTGLGLAITRRVVDEHQGAIEVESEYGHGSTFTVTLPQAS